MPAAPPGGSAPGARNTACRSTIDLGMSNPKKLEEATFEAEVLQSEGVVLVDFYADWCGPCKMMAPLIEHIAGEFDGRLSVGKLDVDSSPGVAMRYGIMGIPTLG